MHAESVRIENDLKIGVELHVFNILQYASVECFFYMCSCGEILQFIIHTASTCTWSDRMGK